MLLHKRHTSFPRISALWELPKTVEDIARNKSFAGKVEETRAVTKAMLTVLHSSCTDPVVI